VPKILCIFSDGGSDHRLTHASMQIAVMALAKSLNLEALICCRTAPYHSFTNPAERQMAIFNIGMYGVSIARARLADSEEKDLSKVKTTAEFRLNEKAYRPLVQESLKLPSEQLNARFSRLTLKGVPFKENATSVSDEDIKAFKEELLSIDAKFDLDDLTQKGVKNKLDYKAYAAKHLRKSLYSLQYFKCDDEKCCKRSDFSEEDFKELRKGVPLPRSCGDRYLPFEQAYASEETDVEPCPSESAHDANSDKRVGAFLQKMIVATIPCKECQKPRCIFSSDRSAPFPDLSLLRFVCGTPLVDAPSNAADASSAVETETVNPEAPLPAPQVAKPVKEQAYYVRSNIQCSSPVEFGYYAVKPTIQICCRCASTEVDEKLIASHKTQFKTVLPLCNDAQCVKLGPVSRGPLKPVPSAKKKRKTK